jgi:uncharacterized MAPEG superfamily protein
MTVGGVNFTRGFLPLGNIGNKIRRRHMSSELSILALYGLVVMVTILAQVLSASGQVGLSMLAKAREDMPPLVGIAGRLDRAQINSIVALALFAPAVLALHAQGGSTPGTFLAAQIFLFARVLYALFYAVGTPWLRTGAWIVAFLATGYLYVMAL